MAFLTIAGKNYPVAHGNANEDAPTMGGAITRAYSGGLRKTTRWTKRHWSFTLSPIWQHEFNLLRADTLNAASVTVTGDALGNVALTAAVLLGQAAYIADDPLFRRSVQVTVMEV